MSEPSKWAFEAAQELAVPPSGCETATASLEKWMVLIIQQAIDAALAEKDAEIERLKIERDSIKCACDFAELACDRQDKRIAELEAQIRTCDVIITRKDNRLASLQALMERMPHESLQDKWDCRTDCPRCAYEKWKENKQ